MIKQIIYDNDEVRQRTGWVHNRYDIDPTHTMNHFEDAALGADYTLEQTFSRSRILFGGVCGEFEFSNTRNAA